MANSFFDFDTSLKGDLDPKNSEPLLPEDEDGYENEEDYDALNDETFGACGNDDDWEEQHKQFAKFNESSKHNEDLETTLSHLGLEDLSHLSDDDDSPTELLTFPRDSSVWTYTPPQKNGDIYNSSVLSSLQKASKSFIETQTAQNPVLSYLNDQVVKGSPANNAVPPIKFPLQPGKICTVEELEKNLIKSSQQQQLAQGHQKQIIDSKLADQQYVQQQNHLPPNQINVPHPQGQQRPLLSMPPHAIPPYHPMLQHPGTRLPPPGLPPLNVPPPNLRHMPPINHPMMHPGFRMMPPHLHMMPPNGPRPPGYPYQLPVNHPFNYAPPPNHGMMPPMVVQQKMPSRPHPMQQQQYSPQKQLQQHLQLNHQRMRHDSGSSRYSSRDQQEPTNKDEYSGLMTPKDKQWLLNIQMIQLNTGTPYFDDYYYTIYKERKSKTNKENNPNNKFPHTGRQRRNSERQENSLTPRVYTPLQFENSLGKLQCGSVTAPRKIIDMDVVQPDKDQELPPSRDSKKTKQYLLELEALYSLLLKAEDINNPLYISNMEKWREMKQKQRLRELEQATTSEQKQEVLRLFKLESEPVVENELDYINKILTGFVQDDKFSSFLAIRKGKMLLLRLLPHLSLEEFGTQLLEVWSKVLLSLPVTGRRDTAGDNLLPKLYPFFKQFVQTCTMSDITDMISGLVEEVKPQENSRSTPLSHTGKAPLYFVVLNKFGVSALVGLFLRAETIFSTVDPTEKQRNDWSHFLIAWAKHAESVSKVAKPLDEISSEVFDKHVARFKQLTADKRAILEKHFVDVHHIHY